MPAPPRSPAASVGCAAAGWSISARWSRTLREAGVEITEEADGLRVRRLNGLHGVDVMTEPYPGFPTDMQAQFMALMAVAEGAAMVTETIFENRFMHVPELNRMGARINVHGASAHRARRAAAVRRAGDGDRSARLGLAGPGRARGARARRWSTASITSTAATSGGGEARRLRRRYRAARRARARR